MNIVYVFIDDVRYFYNGLEISSEKFTDILSAYYVLCILIRYMTGISHEFLFADIFGYRSLFWYDDTAY